MDKLAVELDSRKIDIENGAFTRDPFCCDMPVVRLDYLAADGQANAGALVFAGSMEPLENLKYAFGIGGIEADAVVGHADLPKFLRSTYSGDLHRVDVDEFCGDRYEWIGACSFVFYGV